MSFQPAVLAPSPDPYFVRELRRIDPDLRVLWGYNNYLVHQWVIERRMTPERYFTCYASLLETNNPRFVKQPIFDTNQPEYDIDGNQTGYKIIGYRDYDLAPEWEYVMFAGMQLDNRTLLELRRTYAWERNHSLTRLRIEKEQADEQRKEALKKQRLDAIPVPDLVDEVKRDLGKKVQSK